MGTLNPYSLTLLAMAFTAFLILLQIIVADVAAFRVRHKPGYPIPADSDDFLFRSARAHANTNESVAIFALLAVTGILSSANPVWLGTLAWVYLICRVIHMLAYYVNLSLLRSAAFGVSLIALLGMFITVILGWVG